MLHLELFRGGFHLTSEVQLEVVLGDAAWVGAGEDQGLRGWGACRAEFYPGWDTFMRLCVLAGKTLGWGIWGRPLAWETDLFRARSFSTDSVSAISHY